MALSATSRMHFSSLHFWFGSALTCLALGLLGCSEGGSDPSSTAGSAGDETGSAGSGMGGASAGTTAMAGDGGEAGTGGDGGAGGTGVDEDLLRLFEFASDTEGWAFVYAEPADLIAAVPAAGPDGGVVDAGPAPEGVARATHDAADGSPDPGSVLLNLPFSAVEQKISYEVDVSNGASGVDLTGRMLRCRLKVDSGLSTPDGPAGLKLYVKSGATSLYADGGWNNINVDGEWQVFTWGVNNPGYVDPAGTHDPADVRQVGIEIATGSAGMFTEGVLHFDSFGY